MCARSISIVWWCDVLWFSWYASAVERLFVWHCISNRRGGVALWKTFNLFSSILHISAAWNGTATALLLEMFSFVLVYFHNSFCFTNASFYKVIIWPSWSHVIHEEEHMKKTRLPCKLFPTWITLYLYQRNKSLCMCDSLNRVIRRWRYQHCHTIIFSRSFHYWTRESFQHIPINFYACAVRLRFCSTCHRLTAKVWNLANVFTKHWKF